ncbi:hypothetical protein F5141DRAFT_1067850 [Pisolithus sp. B1]|nr:hypothetical protein F5141DRAFT_1067850 [Pisolithus sp. B1]
MMDYYWPTSLPTEIHKDYIMQVRYSIEPTDDEEVYRITQTNFHEDDPEAKHRCFIPSYYFVPIIAFLWKYYLYIGLYLRFHGRRQKKFKQFLPHLIKCIVHLDNVIEAFICPILSVPLDEITNYHSQNFNEYLTAEIILGCHDPEAFKIFRSQCPINIERMNPEDFAQEWLLHRDCLPPFMEGTKYEYDIDVVPNEDWEVLWIEVQEWHKCKLDIKWIPPIVTSCVPWEDDGGNIIYPPGHRSNNDLDESHPVSPDHGSYGLMENKHQESDEGERSHPFPADVSDALDLCLRGSANVFNPVQAAISRQGPNNRT